VGSCSSLCIGGEAGRWTPVVHVGNHPLHGTHTKPEQENQATADDTHTPNGSDVRALWQKLEQVTDALVALAKYTELVSFL